MSRPLRSDQLRHGMGGARGPGQGVPGGCCVGVSALTSNGLQIYLRRCKVLCLAGSAAAGPASIRVEHVMNDSSD